jgi:hypothetical protein
MGLCRWVIEEGRHQLSSSAASIRQRVQIIHLLAHCTPSAHDIDSDRSGSTLSCRSIIGATDNFHGEPPGPFAALKSAATNSTRVHASQASV